MGQVFIFRRKKEEKKKTNLARSDDVASHKIKFLYNLTAKILKFETRVVAVGARVWERNKWSFVEETNGCKTCMK